ncbi:hypothetical protein MP638_007538 [Amoeboaphelidium occidentale]|nr:hypothetical protein MP638_007538 [Amoeboaphelidium occidentale]
MTVNKHTSVGIEDRSFIAVYDSVKKDIFDSENAKSKEETVRIHQRYATINSKKNSVYSGLKKDIDLLQLSLEYIGEIEPKINQNSQDSVSNSPASSDLPPLVPVKGRKEYRKSKVPKQNADGDQRKSLIDKMFGWAICQ